jgi:hypothetical protein
MQLASRKFIAGNNQNGPHGASGRIKCRTMHVHILVAHTYEFLLHGKSFWRSWFWPILLLYPRPLQIGFLARNTLYTRFVILLISNHLSDSPSRPSSKPRSASPKSTFTWENGIAKLNGMKLQIGDVDVAEQGRSVPCFISSLVLKIAYLTVQLVTVLVTAKDMFCRHITKAVPSLAAFLVANHVLKYIMRVQLKITKFPHTLASPSSTQSSSTL